MKEKVEDLHNFIGETNGLTDIKIDASTVDNAIHKLKNGKSYAVDDIPNEFLKHGGASLIKSIAELFNVFTL